MTRSVCKTLQSDVAQDEAREALATVQATSAVFCGFTDSEVDALSDHFSVMTFDKGQTILERGETGTWFGVLLSGTLSVVINPEIVFVQHPGTIIGEMAMWQSDSVRSATLKGAQPGVIATMLVTELPQLVLDHPQAGAKLMRCMAQSAMSKTLSNTRNSRRHRSCPNHASFAARPCAGLRALHPTSATVG